jgi:hypothetical protein
MIVERLGDGQHAFDRFFTLLDEYHARVPRIVARLSGCERTYTVEGEERPRRYPSEISLISYHAEDPGLFVSAEGPDDFPYRSFCPSLSWFESFFGPCGSKMAIFDQAAYNLWAHWDYSAT